MGEAALALAADQTNADASQDWGMRLAQQSIAALIDGGKRLGSFRVATLRATARARLSTLSGDDRGRIERWLALLIATQSLSAASNGLDTLATVDPAVAASVRANLPAALISCGLGLAKIDGPDSGHSASQAGCRSIRRAEAAGLPPADRPSMLSPLFR